MASRPDKDAGGPSAYQRALGLLVRREHSRKELARKLRAKGVATDDMDVVLETLCRQEFQSDERFAEALARTRAGSAHGPSRIRAELASHGIGRDLVEAALEACQADWQASAQGLVARRYGGKDLSDQALRRKAVDFLLRRGFDQKMAFAAVKSNGNDIDCQDLD